jgi:hypothetical protein
MTSTKSKMTVNDGLARRHTQHRKQNMIEFKYTPEERQHIADLGLALTEAMKTITKPDTPHVVVLGALTANVAVFVQKFTPKQDQEGVLAGLQEWQRAILKEAQQVLP